MASGIAAPGQRRATEAATAGRTGALPMRPLGSAPAELGEADLLHVALRPELGEQVVDLRSPQSDHQERFIAELAQRGVDELDRWQIAPVQIVEGEQHRARGALGADEMLEGQPHLLGHDGRGRPRRAEQRALVVRERRAGQLAQERGHPRPILLRDAQRGAVHELLPAHLQRLAFPHSHRIAQGRREQREGRACAQRIAPPEPHRDAVAAPLDRAKQLVQEPGFAAASR
ncbi:hypothetical protein WMF21_21305 [Sorangium sp. So ce1099]